jgi:hypothetical protein
MSDWKTLRPPTFTKTPRMSDFCDIIEWPDGKWKRVRPIGPIIGYAYHWLTIYTKTSREATFPKLCLNYDQSTDTYRGNKYHKERLISGCPYCDSPFPRCITFYSNFIDRDLEGHHPPKLVRPLPEEQEQQELLDVPCYFKVKNSRTWTPIKAGRIPSSLNTQLQSLVHINRRENPNNPGEFKYFALSHPRRGMDIIIRMDKGPSVRYDGRKYESSQLTKQELKYLWQPIHSLRPGSFADALRSYQSLQLRFVTNSKGDEGSSKRDSKWTTAASNADFE